MDRKKLGVLGEKIAENFLKNNGYKILDKNYSFRIPGSPQKGEIDIVAEKDQVIAFVEVKALASKANAFSPQDRVDYKKRRKIIKAAESWLLKNKILTNIPWRIDIVAVRVDRLLMKAKIQHFKNAVSG